MPRQSLLRALFALLLLTPLSLRAQVPEDATSSATDLTPGAIYERALRNLMESAILDLRILSVDSGGHRQRYEVEMMWRRYLDGSDEVAEGILSRALARYREPRDLRQSGVLVVNRLDAADDQYVYTRSSRRIRRFNMRAQNVFGTDFAVEDLVPRGLFHADYRRQPDAGVDGTPCFVVEALFEKGAEAHYSRGLFYVDQVNYVPLLVRYWDHSDVEVKHLRVDVDGIREIEGLHVPTRMTIHSLPHDSYTRLEIETLVANPEIPPSYFSVRHLEQHATSGLPESYYVGAHEFRID